MKKHNAIPCAIVLVVLTLMVGAAIHYGPKLFHWARAKLKEEKAREQALSRMRRELASAWQAPPKDVTPEKFFPARVGDYRRISRDKNAAIPDLRIHVEGLRAIYRSGESEIQVHAYRVTRLETEALFARIKELYEAENQIGFKRYTSKLQEKGYARCYVSSPDLGKNHLWFIKDWLLVFRTEDSEDREPFVWDFVKASG